MLTRRSRELLDHERANPGMCAAKLQWLSDHGWPVGRHHQQIDRLLLDIDAMAEYPDVAARAAQRRERTIIAGQSNKPAPGGA